MTAPSFYLQAMRLGRPAPNVGASGAAMPARLTSHQVALTVFASSRGTSCPLGLQYLYHLLGEVLFRRILRFMRLQSIMFLSATIFMADDWRDWFRSRLHPEGFAHPDSPAGGSGTGFARPPGPQRYSWSSSRIPHPDSPAGRTFNWQSELVHIEHQEREDLQRQIEELERFLTKQSAIFRENLPDPSLQDIYDRQTDRTKTSGFARSIDHTAPGATHYLNSLLQPLAHHIQWFDANSRDLPQKHELRILLGTKRIAWEHGTVEEKRKLLNQVRGFAEGFYEAAIKSIQKQWAEATRAGRREELIELWKRQLLQPRIAYSGSGIGQTQREIEEQQRSKARPEKRPEPPPRTPTVVKTWVEFQLIDEDRQPVPNASYKVKLPDGSVQNGRLDGQGRVRFDNIDPGQCEITFTEVDAKEWHKI